MWSNISSQLTKRNLCFFPCGLFRDKKINTSERDSKSDAQFTYPSLTLHDFTTHLPMRILNGMLITERIDERFVHFPRYFELNWTLWTKNIFDLFNNRDHISLNIDRMMTYFWTNSRRFTWKNTRWFRNAWKRGEYRVSMFTYTSV